MPTFRHPVVVVSHGPDPLWLLTLSYEGMNRHTRPAHTLAALFPKLYPGDKNLPKRILFVSAHFESKHSDGFEIPSSANPKMFYDYSGFPAKTYQVNSGQSTHNLRGVRDLNHPIVDWAAAFQDWIDDTFTSKSALTYEQCTKQIVN